MFEKTEGIVLRVTEYKDSDKLLTVLTRDLGKVTLKARGAKSKNSRLRAASQLLAFSEFTVSDYQGRYVITEAVCREMFPELQSELELLYLASYFVQVCDTVAQEADPMPELLSLLLNCLYALSKLHKPQTMVKAVFELRTACLAGFTPDLRSCVICGNEEPDRFNITQGVLQCAGCGSEEPNSIRMPLSSAVLNAMRFICGVDSKHLFSFRLSGEACTELSQITESYLLMRLERGFSALDFYKSLLL